MSSQLSASPQTISNIDMLQFPAEIWQKIFQHLGPYFFARNLDKLAICKTGSLQNNMSDAAVELLPHIKAPKTV